MFLVLASPQCWELQANIIKISSCLLNRDVESGSKPYLELLNYGVALVLSADISFSRKNLLKERSNAAKGIEVSVTRDLQEESVGAVWGASFPQCGSGVDGRHSYPTDSSEFTWSPSDRDNNTWETQQGGSWEAPSATQTPPATCRGNLAAY